MAEPAKNPESVLVADDEAPDRKFAVDILREDGFRVQEARSGPEAGNLLERGKFDLVITDLVMPGMSGFDVIRLAIKLHPECICIAMTSFGSLDSAMDALRMGAYSFLTKPCDAGEFRHRVQRGLEKQRLANELRQRNQALEQLNRELDQKVQEATRELRDLNHRMLTEMASLQEVDKLKSAFLDTVTHDLKSPLTTIQAYLEMAVEESLDKLSETARSCMHSMRRAVSHMDYLVNQLIEAAQLKSGKIRLDVKAVSVPETLDEAASLAKSAAQAKEIRVDVQWKGDPSFTLRADRGRLLQILNNLLGNSIKFTPKSGRIALSAWPEGSGAHFCVEDTGPGIAPEHHKRIFERFYQVSSGTTREFKGLGLGLGIVRDLVEIHHGKVWVESELGKGSKFHVALPSQS